MKIKLVIVSSVDGKITKWHDGQIKEWTSDEDQEYFSKVIADSKLIIMGRKTFAEATGMMKFEPGRLRVIITGEPEKYTELEIKDTLEFKKGKLTEIVKDLEKRGYKEATLVGGGETNREFLKNHLIDEIWLTIEPKIFGSGQGIVAGAEFEQELRLISLEKLNEGGTLLVRYKVL
jgi:dihydrofolate reductase